MPSREKIFFNLRPLKARLGAFELGDLAPETIAAIALELNVRADEVIDTNRRLSGADHSLQAPRDTLSDGEWIDMVPDCNPTQEVLVIDLEESRQQRSLVQAALTKLGPRERDILVELYLTDNPPTLVELSQRYAVSSERVRQIEVRAVGKLQNAMKAASTASDFARGINKIPVHQRTA
jgi:RNA polymerase sigma-32 factor